MKTQLQSGIPEAGFQTLFQQLDAVNELIAPHFVNLTNRDKTGMRTMSTSREGYVRLVNGIANSNVDALPRNIDPAVLTARLDYHDSLAALEQRLIKAKEMISEIGLANGLEIMKLSDTLATSLQTARNYSGALDGAMAEVDEWNKRFTRREKEQEQAPLPE